MRTLPPPGTRLESLVRGVRTIQSSQQNHLARMRPGTARLRFIQRIARGCFVLDLILVKEWAVTKAEWLACTDSTPMIAFQKGKISDRKLRLFIVACARCLWNLIPEGELRASVELGERQADGLASEEEVKQIHSVLYGYFLSSASEDQRSWVYGAVKKKLSTRTVSALRSVRKDCQTCLL
jgi:hypothetical protein